MTKPTPVLRKEFHGTEPFQALHAAEAWLARHGFSYGSNQRGAPTGIKHGDFAIAKWRNLRPRERDELDGMIEAGDHRNGPVAIVIYGDRSIGAMAVVQGFADAA